MLHVSNLILIVTHLALLIKQSQESNQLIPL
jgi:hypothetical protein